MTTAMLLEEKDGPLDRRVYSIAAASPDELVASVAPSLGHFVLFLAWDATEVSHDVIFSLALQLVRKGLAYVVAWGPDCERVHDIFDEADIQENPESNLGSETVIMSTWHDTEPLEQPLWFALNTAYPAPPYHETCFATIAATIGNPRWAEKVHRYLSDLPSLDRAVGV